ncbi:hypothetical protein ABZU75_29005 [Streptosporangium sp. NPDC005286]|uniref:hypothetical protein n=1 Tax=Streptosporangium sp. NPDC005286 TaxID=3154463 RepID=UPI0033AA146F
MSSRVMATTDGMHSTVREQAGIEFEGGQYAESFSLADVRLTGGVPDDEVVLYFAPAGLVVVAPLPDGTHRIVSTVDEAPRDPDVAFVQGCWTAGAREGSGRWSARSSGGRASASTTGWPAPSVPGGSCSPPTPRTSTVPQEGRE